MVSVVGDGVVVVPHSVFPELTPTLLEKIQGVLSTALRDRGHIDDDARHSVRRMFYRQQRSPPDLLVMPP